MEGNGITPVMPINNGYDNFGGSWIFLFAILALMWGGNGAFGNGNLGYRPATAEDVNNGFNFNDLQNQNRDLMNAITAGTAQAVSATNQAKYDNINAAKDIQIALTAELGRIEGIGGDILAKQNECCCNVLRGLDGVNYNAALNTAAIKDAILLDGQKTRDLITTNKIEALQQRINKLELNSALAGVVRYPNSTSYDSGTNPFYGGGTTTA